MMNIYVKKKFSYKRFQLSFLKAKRVLLMLILWILTFLVYYTSDTRHDTLYRKNDVLKIFPSLINKEFENKLNSNPVHSNLIEGNPVHSNLIEGNSVQSNLIGGNPVHRNLIESNLVHSNLIEDNPLHSNLIEGNPVHSNLIEASGDKINDNLVNGNLVTGNVSSVNLLSKNQYFKSSSSGISLDSSVGHVSSSSSGLIHMEVRQNTIKTSHNIIFLKTHKTGSSTVTNILQRYALSHHLNAALPQCDHRFCYPNKFDEGFLYEHQFGETYNILFNHAVFHKEKMLKIMSSANSKIITIVREPFSQFDSAAQYLNFKKFFNVSGDLPILDEFFKIPADYLKRYLQSVYLTEGHGALALAKNPNAFDFGFDVWNETPEYIQYVIKSVTQDFSLVMIMEYMEESLVLLKNEMDWELEDVLFYSHNVRSFKDKNTNNIEKAKENVLSWNKLDSAIYKHFNETFWLRIKNSPSEFYAEVNTLKNWNIDLINHCHGIVTPSSVLLVQKYELLSNSVLCSDILRDDELFTAQFKSTRFARFYAKS